MNKKHLSIFLVIVFLLIAGIIATYLLNSKTGNLETEITTLNSEVASLSVQSARLMNLRQVVSSTGGELDTLSGFFVESGGALDFVKYIESLAVSSGLNFKIDLVDEVADATLAPHDKVFLKTAIRTTGSLKNTRIFFALIESLPYNVKINRIDLRRAGDDWAMVIDFSVVKMAEK